VWSELKYSLAREANPTMKKELVDGIKAFWGYVMAAAKCQWYIKDTYVVVPLTAKEELQDTNI